MKKCGKFLFAALVLLSFFCILDPSGVGFRKKLRAMLDYISGELQLAQFFRILQSAE